MSNIDGEPAAARIKLPKLEPMAPYRAIPALSQLAVQFNPDSDGTGKLTFVQTRGFSGTGAAMFHAREVETFGRRLRDTYPIPPKTEIQLRGGYWKSRGSPPELEEVLAGVRVYAIGSTGLVGIHVEVQDEGGFGQRPESGARLQVEIHTHYEPLRSFGQSILQIVAHEDPLEVATLDAD